MDRAKFRRDLSAPGLMSIVRKCFRKIPDTVKGRKWDLSDYLMSGLAIFVLKYPSLLAFDRHAHSDETVQHNLRELFGLDSTPSDTAVRERLDEVDPFELRGAFKKVFAALQRGKALEKFTYLGHYLLSVDGTGYHSSSTVKCDHCCQKHHRDGSVTYYHQMLGAVLVHPKHKEVIPLPPEPIMKSDGDKKNDCERNASKRLLRHIRREHPHLKLIVVEDGLASNGPHIKLLQELNMPFILGAKPDDHKLLFDWVETVPGTKTFETTDCERVKYEFRYHNGAPLNDTHYDLKVNYLECLESRPGKKKQFFTWVTDLEITEANVEQIMRAARARWRIENETFNTLKNQGYGFEHNYGHGKKHLTTVFANLMMLAFLIDQAQLICCPLFRAALEKEGRRSYLWETMRGKFKSFLLPDWETFYGIIAYGMQPYTPVVAEVAIIDTS